VAEPTSVSTCAKTPYSSSATSLTSFGLAAQTISTTRGGSSLPETCHSCKETIHSTNRTESRPFMSSQRPSAAAASIRIGACCTVSIHVGRDFAPGIKTVVKWNHAYNGLAQLFIGVLRSREDQGAPFYVHLLEDVASVFRCDRYRRAIVLALYKFRAEDHRR